MSLRYGRYRRYAATRSRGENRVSAVTRVRFRIELSEESWIADISRAFPDAALRMDGVITDGDTGFALLATDGVRRGAVVDALCAHDGVDAAETIATGARETTVYVAADTPRFVSAARRSGLPIDPPVEVVDGKASLAVVGDHDRVSLLTEQFGEAGMAFDIERVGGGAAEAARVLTDTQRELVAAALEAGYYDTPRTCTLTELAERRGIAKSTCSETLQRAEEQLIKRVADRLVGVDTPAGGGEPEAAAR